MFLDIFVNLFKAFWTIAKIPLLIFVSFLAIMGVLCVVNIFYLRVFKGQKKPVGERYRLKNRNFFQKLFIDAPRQFAIDYMNRNPEFFRHQGVIVFTGLQGRGKTVALVHQTLQYQREYPKCKVIGNLNYKHQDDVLDHWSKLIDYKNSIQGVVVQMDEMQVWFSSNQSKDFPPEMLEVVTQNRKNRRVILGTSQVFTRLSKPLREQTTEIRECHTFAGCITVVIKKEPILNTMGDVEKLKYRGMYFFVHNQEIRDAYDTYKVVESLRESGFAPATGDVNNNVSVFMDKKAMKAMKKR